MFSFRTKLVLAYIAIYFVWGSTFLFVKIALGSFPPFILSALRFIIGGTALLLFSIITKKSFPEKSELKKHSILGIVIFIGGVVAVVWAQQHISSSMASAIITTPFWFVVLDKSQWKFYFKNPLIIGGLVLGLVGVILLMTEKTAKVSNASDGLQFLSILVMISGSLLWVLGSLYLKTHPSSSSVYPNTSIQLLSAGVFCLLLNFASNNSFDLSHATFEGWGAVIYLAIVSTTITFLAFIWLIKVQTPAIVSTYSYVNPIVATFLGWTFGQEHISKLQLVALGVILCGLLLVNMGKFSKMKQI
ncbi:EamA family transporter [Lacihabitans sp. LS3-19]|uniref:EamA family transporter n=1 Tax=Lacihabitans sp. LS3-19 TaxID=2487335 RepID=UPI0020CC8DC5|nr:EamA family transporter [Lacihabitans sp. LS3-19]MCP9766341.1 EamA family transporter [Lacihabitans sp. LS3-19]